jgi:hypothetical protein
MFYLNVSSLEGELEFVVQDEDIKKHDIIGQARISIKDLLE